MFSQYDLIQSYKLHRDVRAASDIIAFFLHIEPTLM